MAATAAPAPTRGTFQIVSFKLGTEEYGVAISSVKEINRFVPITNVPRSAPFIEGVIDLRGSLVTVVDLRAKFGMATCERDRDTRIVIVDAGTHRVGLIVDAVCEVVRVSDEELADVPDLVANLNTSFIDKVVKHGDRLIVLLDLTHIFTRHETHATRARAAA